MISNEYGQHKLECDICGEVASRRHENFQDAVDYKKEIGWKSKKIDGDWCDICPDCQ